MRTWHSTHPSACCSWQTLLIDGCIRPCWAQILAQMVLWMCLERAGEMNPLATWDVGGPYGGKTGSCLCREMVRSSGGAGGATEVLLGQRITPVPPVGPLSHLLLLVTLEVPGLFTKGPGSPFTGGPHLQMAQPPTFGSQARVSPACMRPDWSSQMQSRSVQRSHQDRGVKPLHRTPNP